MKISREYTGPIFSPESLTQPPWKDILEEGKFNASMLSELLGWSMADMAKFLGKSVSAISRQPLAAKDQHKLGALVALLSLALDLASGDLDAMKAWLMMPIWAFDNQSAKDLILKNELESVKNLIEELKAGK